MRSFGRGTALAVAALLAAGIISCSKDNGPADLKEQQADLRSELDSTIADVDREMSRVRNDLQAADETARLQLNAEMDRLQSTRDGLQQGLNRLAETTADGWNEFVATTDSTLEKARETLKDIRTNVAQEQQTSAGG